MFGPLCGAADQWLVDQSDPRNRYSNKWTLLIESI